MSVGSSPMERMSFPDATSLTYIDEVLIEFQNGATQFTSNVASGPLDDASALSFNTIAGADYTLEYTEDVAGTNGWNEVDWTVLGDGGNRYVLDPNSPTGAADKIYRVVGQ